MVEVVSGQGPASRTGRPAGRAAPAGRRLARRDRLRPRSSNTSRRPSLERLVELAAAKLAPGGVLLLETINPTSVYALVHAFFADPSHRSPVHPETLRFLMEAAGLVKAEILYSGRIEPERLMPVPGQGEAALALNRNLDKLNRLLYGAPNYAATARKA